MIYDSKKEALRDNTCRAFRIDIGCTVSISCQRYVWILFYTNGGSVSDHFGGTLHYGRRTEADVNDGICT